MSARSAIIWLVPAGLCSGLGGLLVAVLAQDVSAKKSRPADKKHTSATSPSHASTVVSEDKANPATKGKGKRDEPRHPPNSIFMEGVMAFVGQALFQYHHVLDFSGALFAASLMSACECDFEIALSKIAPSDEAAKALRVSLPGPVKVISAAMQGEQRALQKSGVAKVLPLSVAAVVRKLNEKGGRIVRDTQFYYLPCNDVAKDRDGRGVAVTVILDLPWTAIRMDRPEAMDGLEATVWVQFLVCPGDPKGKENGSQTWNVESRKLRFVLKGENWIKE